VNTYNGKLHTSFPLTAAYTEALGRHMLDVAILDKKLFAKLEAAYDAVAEMRHIRQSLITYIESDDEHDMKHFPAFPGYALPALSRVQECLETLYQSCTRKELTVARVR
jgi:hypothetical protein